MKRILAACAVTLLATSVVFADTQGDAKTFTQGLRDAQDTCTSAYSLARQKQQLASMSAAQDRQIYGNRPDLSAAEATMESDLKTFLKCREEAKADGEVLYRSFITKAPTAELKADAKQVFVAWLSWLTRASGDLSDYDSREWSEYKKATSALEVDSLAP